MWHETNWYDALVLYYKDNEWTDCCHPFIFQRKTIASRQHSIHWKIRPRDRSVRQVRDKYNLSHPLQCVLHRSLGSDPQVGAKSITPIPISFDALSTDPILLKGCVLWNRCAFIVRTMVCARDNRRTGVVTWRATLWAWCGRVRMNMFLSWNTATYTCPCTFANNTVRISVVHVSDQKQCSLFVRWSKNAKKSPACRSFEVVPYGSGYSTRPMITRHTVVPQFKAHEHDEARLRWYHWRKWLRWNTKSAVAEMKSFLRHIFSRQRSVESWWERWLFVTSSTDIT